MEILELLISNLSGTKARREVLQGQDYLVAPIVLIVPGVLNGSEGALYYPPEEVSKDPNRWNFIPITLNHPPKSANDPEILNSFGLGFLLNSRYESPKINPITEHGRLIADGWFNLIRTMKADPRIVTALNSGSRIEVSTGLKLHKEVLTNELEHNGKKYKVVTRNYQPDHLAILMDATGACSVRDGCGVLMNELKEIVTTKCSPDERRELVLTLNSSLTGEPTMANKELVDALIQNCSCWTDTAEDRKILDNMDDKKIQLMIDAAKKSKEEAAVANAAKAGFEGEEGTYVWNAADGKMELKKKMRKGKDGKMMTEEEMKKQMEEEEGKKVTKNEVTKETILNVMKGMTAAEHYEILPPEMQEDLRESRKIKEEAKAGLVAQWVDNAAEDKKTSAKAWAEKQTLETLREVCSTIPVKNTSGGNNPYRADYSGAAPAFAHNRGETLTKPVPLGVPEWDFAPAK